MTDPAAPPPALTETEIEGWLLELRRNGRVTGEQYVFATRLLAERAAAAERIMVLEAARDSYARIAHQLGQEFINRLATNFTREPPA